MVLAAGCATDPSKHAQTPADAVYVEGETVTPTGSRISHTVRKGQPAGVAGGMAGGVVGGGTIAHEQNDVNAAGQLAPGKGP